MATRAKMSVRDRRADSTKLPIGSCPGCSSKRSFPTLPECYPCLSRVQAAIAAGKAYTWAVDAGSDGADGALFARLLTVIDGCVAPEPTSRLTVPQLLDSLTALLHDVTRTSTANGSVGQGGGYASPVTPPSAVAAVAPPPLSSTGSTSSTYDVLAIIDAMEALSIDSAVVSAVSDAIGSSLTSTFEPLTAHKVPIMKAAAVRKAVAGASPAPAATTLVRDRDRDFLGHSLCR